MDRPRARHKALSFEEELDKLVKYDKEQKRITLGFKRDTIRIKANVGFGVSPITTSLRLKFIENIKRGDLGKTIRHQDGHMGEKAASTYNLTSTSSADNVHVQLQDRPADEKEEVTSPPMSRLPSTNQHVQSGTINFDRCKSISTSHASAMTEMASDWQNAIPKHGRQWSSADATNFQEIYPVHEYPKTPRNSQIARNQSSLTTQSDDPEMNSQQRQPDVLLQRLIAKDLERDYRHSFHALVHKHFDVYGIIFLQLLMYVGTFAIARLTATSTSSICEPGSAWGRGSWFTGLVLVAGKRLFWGNIIGEDNLGLFDNFVVSYGPVSATLASLQVFEAAIPTSFFCDFMRENEVTRLIWLLVCVFGWFTAWDREIDRVLAKTSSRPLLSYVNPIAALVWLINFAFVKAFQSVLRQRFRTPRSKASKATDKKFLNWNEVPTRELVGMIVLVALTNVAFLICVIISEILYRLRITTILAHNYFCLLSLVITFIIGLILSSVYSQGGLGGLATSMAIVGLGGVFSCVGVDRALWIVWWIALLWPFRDQRTLDALFQDGLDDAGESATALYVFLVLTFVVGREYHIERAVGTGRFKWLEPFGYYIAEIKSFSNKIINEFLRVSGVHAAVLAGHAQTVRDYLFHNGDPNKRDDETRKNTPLFYTVLDDNHQSVEIARLLIRYGAEIDARDLNNATPLLVGCKRGATDVVHLLLDKQADPNTKTNSQNTPISRASKCGHDEIVKLLIDHRAKIDEPNKDGDTPLHRAALRAKDAHTQVVNLLLTAGANPALKSIKKDTPLTLVCDRTDYPENRARIIKALWEKAGGLQAEDGDESPVVNILRDKNRYGKIDKGRSEVMVRALAECMLGSENPHPECLRFAELPEYRSRIKELVETKAIPNVDARLLDGETALTSAKIRGKADVVRFLLELGADETVQNKGGLSYAYLNR